MNINKSISTTIILAIPIIISLYILKIYLFNSFEYVDNHSKNTIKRMMKYGDKIITNKYKEVIYTLIYLFSKLTVSDLDNVKIPQMLDGVALSDAEFKNIKDKYIKYFQNDFIRNRKGMENHLNIQKLTSLYELGFAEILIGYSVEFKINQLEYDLLKTTYETYKDNIENIEKAVLVLGKKYNVPKSSINELVEKKYDIWVKNDNGFSYTYPATEPNALSFVGLLVCSYIPAYIDTALYNNSSLYRNMSEY